MSIRAFAFVLALLVAASPALELVCQMDCDQPLKSASCHESTASPIAPSLRNVHLACDHDHAAPPALVSSGGVRDSRVAAADALATAPSHVAAVGANLPAASRHGPPRLDSRSLFSRTTVLRI